MTVDKGKRPRDPNQLAKVVDRSTSEEQLTTEPNAALQAKKVSADISEYMAKIGRRGGKVGGKRRLDTMTAAKRRNLAKKAAEARWGNRPNAG